MVFIDGDHSFEGVKQDFEDFGSMADKYILLDDIRNRGGVEKFWTEIVEPSYETTIVGEWPEDDKRRRGFEIVDVR